MEKLSTKSIETSVSRTAPVITPGNHTMKINKFYLQAPNYASKHEKEYFLVFDLESKPVTDQNFQGFKDENGRPYAGQIGRVKYSRYSFVEGKELPDGRKTSIVNDIMLAMVNLSNSLGQRDVLDSIEANTIEELVTMASSALCPTAFLDFCVGGKEYEGKSGYTNYDMYLVKSSRGNYAFGPEGSDKVITYNADEHLIKKEEKPISGFNGANSLEDF